MSDKSIVLTKEDLQDILTTAIAAAKAPNAVEQAQLDRQMKEIQQKQADRKEQGAQVLADIAAKRDIQAICTHEHDNGQSHAVWVQESTGPGYFICQLNQCKIRPEPKPEKGADNGAIYNTREFNRLFQKSRTNELFG